MQTEIEAKFANADHDTLRRKLQELGAVCEQPMRLMKRYNYDFPDGRLGNAGGWVRLRDEGGKITLSYKQLDGRGLHDTKEVSFTVDSFEAADAFARAIGLVSKNYQETRRESWRLGDIEIELDEWPWAKPYVEMEGPDEASLRDIADKLGLDWSKVCHGSVEVIYRDEFAVDDKEFNSIQTFTFEEPIPEWLEKRRQV